MKIHILTMEDPLYTIDFFEEIIQQRYPDISGVTIAKGGRLKTGGKTSKISYLISLLLIMGPRYFTRNVLKTLGFKIRKKASSVFTHFREPGLKAIAEKYNIPVDYTENPNSETYLNNLKAINPDVVINQSQFIIKKELLEIPNIGVINRHNALLPRNRGRLTPFWVLYNGDRETGVSIHFVDTGIDSGTIIVQKKFPISSGDTFRSVVEKNYELAATAMLEALDRLEQGGDHLMANDEEKATYNSVPTLKEALTYRKNRIIKAFNFT